MVNLAKVAIRIQKDDFEWICISLIIFDIFLLIALIKIKKLQVINFIKQWLDCKRSYINKLSTQQLWEETELSVRQ